MWITETHVTESLREYLTAVLRLAAEELSIQQPRLVFYGEWCGAGDVLRVLPSDGIGGVAVGSTHTVLLDASRNIDTLLHVLLHEVRHLKTMGTLTGAAGERDACRFADEFQARRFGEILELLISTGAENDRHLGTRNHDCATAAAAAEGRA